MFTLEYPVAMAPGDPGTEDALAHEASWFPWFHGSLDSNSIHVICRTCRPDGMVTLETWSPIDHGGVYSSMTLAPWLAWLSDYQYSLFPLTLKASRSPWHQGIMESMFLVDDDYIVSLAGRHPCRP